VESEGEQVKYESKALASHLERRLNSYALAASAAGVSMLALAQPAEAKIVYTPTSLTIGPNGTYQLDLNHDGTTDFKIANYYFCNSDICTGNLNAYPALANGVEGVKGFLGIPFAYALPRGARIGSKVPFSGQFMTGSGSGGLGQWYDVINRYLGLRIAINGKFHYGWARLTVEVAVHAFRISATLTGYAYETIPNKPIIAGRTKGPDVITVEPASLGHLARGASGLSAWRRTNSVAAGH
jgi:hypothetical protein